MECSLTKTEVQQIDRHKYFMSLECGYDVGFAAAKRDWIEHHAQAWREKRQASMLALQREEINRHKWLESEKARKDLGREAALEWIRKYAASWREWYEHEYEGSEA